MSRADVRDERCYLQNLKSVYREFLTPVYYSLPIKELSTPYSSDFTTAFALKTDLSLIKSLRLENTFFATPRRCDRDK